MLLPAPGGAVAPVPAVQETAVPETAVQVGAERVERIRGRGDVERVAG
jgi:hypothetical protein